MPDATDGSAPSKPKVGKPDALARRWSSNIEEAIKARRDFCDEGERIVRRYRNEADKATRSRKRGVAILYSNTDTLQAALYSKTAKPDVRRRYADRDPVGQAAATVLERALAFTDDEGNVDAAINKAVLDFLLPGQGIIRLEYEPVIESRPVYDPVTGMAVVADTSSDGVDESDADDEDEGTTSILTEEYISDQIIHHKYVFWQDYIEGPARDWASMPWVAFKHTLTRDEVEDEIYDQAPPSSTTWGKASDVPLNWKKDGKDAEGTKCEIWEIWDAGKKRRLWISVGHDRPLRVDEDPYGLEGFYPLPEPIAGYTSNDKRIPIAPYKAYEDQADDLDELTRRISALTKSMKRRGIYNQAVPELKRMANAGDDQYIPSPNFNELLKTGGLVGNFLTEDISPIAKVLEGLYKQRDSLVESIYEITGISDIMRGSTDPNETAAAQNIKSSFGSQRLQRQQRLVQKWIRDLLRIKAELICEHFEPDVLSKMTNMQVDPQVMQDLRDNKMRAYSVDIETDSTIISDSAAMQQQRTQLVTGVVQLFQALGPFVPQYPPLMPFITDLANFAIAPAHDARQLEESLDKLTMAVQQIPPKPAPDAAAQPQQDPAVAQAAQLKAQADAAKAGASIQIANIKAQGEASRDQAATQQSLIKLQATREQHAQALQQADRQHNQIMLQQGHQHASDMIQRAHDLQAQQQAQEAAAAQAQLNGQQQ